MSESDRPFKRTKTTHTSNHPTSGVSDIREHSSKSKDSRKGKWRGQSNHKANGNISTSGIQHGESGIFVTCDKGHEKKCLREMEDLLSQYIEVDRIDTVSREEDKNDEDDDDDGKEGDIEADIEAELASMKPIKNDSDSKMQTTSKMSLITLDIPCVTFVRLPNNLDPVKLVYDICTDAAAQPDRPRSRYIKRLTPVTLIQKVLNDGIEMLAEAVLPAHFSRTQTEKDSKDQQGVKFAIRPTIRNNNQIQRDDMIKVIAEKVMELGHGVHKVDLKGYEKLILVEVYRNICGMSVVGCNEDVEGRFRRFNLSEIYKRGREGLEDNG